MTASAEQNFAARLVSRLGPCSYLIDAATGITIPPEDVARLIVAYGACLRSAGLEPGDRVLIGCSPTPASTLVYLGAMYAGLVAIPVDDRTLTSSTTMLLEVTAAKAVWTETALQERRHLRASVVTLQGDLVKDEQAKMSPTRCEPSDLAALMATSGSTGVPRFVMVSHRNLIENTEAIIRSQQLDHDERAMLILPISYCFGASVLHTHFYQGGGVVFDRRFMFPDKVLRSIAQFGCTTFAGVPTVYNSLLRRSGIRQIAMPSLRRLLQAGGGLSIDRIREMRSAVPARFYVMYGQTEATARISCMEPERWEEKAGSVGRPLDNLTVRIVDDAGHDRPPREVGELLVKGPSICSGYLNDPEQTRRVFCDGWLRTRDLARRDEEGYLWIEGRKGAFLKMRGIRVSFAEVEARVTAMPQIYECAASAVNHPEAGEALVLFVVPNAGAEVSQQDIRRHLPAHWALDSIHFVPELPRTSAGKVSLSSLTIQTNQCHAAI